jgi:TolB-like protein/Tfp pilus assembly protein PilF
MAGLIAELKRRNVFKVGIAYLVAAWLLMQITDVVAPLLSLPGWVPRFIFLLLVIGFVPALIFAWAFELTPEGIQRERDVQREESIRHVTGRKLHRAIIAMMALAIVYLVIDNYVLEDEAEPAASAAIEKSIAVLPFRNRSDNAADAHFVDGVHDDILTQLTKLSALDKVISRTSTERYRETELPIPTIGAELGVATILEGGVQRAGDRVRINVQLIGADADEHLWAETYDRELTVENLFSIQSEIAREVVTALHGVLSDEESRQIEQLPTTSLEAHEEYAFGRRELAKRTGEAVLRAEEHFEKAVQLDPGYAMAWVGLAESRALEVEYLGKPVESTVAERQTAIDRALAIDPLLGEPYASQALLRHQLGDIEEAETLYKRAIELNPNYATARQWYAGLLSGKGQYDLAEAQIRRAIELDPAAPVLRAVLTQILMYSGRTDEAVEEIFAGLARNPGFPTFYADMAGALWAQGRRGEALKWMQEAARMNPRSAKYRGGVCQLYIELGDYDSAERCVDHYEAEWPDLNAGLRVWLLSSTGRPAEAVALLERLLEDGMSISLKLLYTQSLFFLGETAKARTLLEETRPRYFGDAEWQPEGPHDLFYAVMAGYVLNEAGESDRAGYLFDRALAAMGSLPRSGTNGYQEMDVLIHIARGEKQKAVVALREAHEANAAFSGSKYRSGPMAPMLDEPEWLAIVEKIEAEFERQRAWYEAHKDEPLF